MPPDDFRIQIRDVGAGSVVRVAGDVTWETSPTFRSVVLDQLNKRRRRLVELDLHGVEAARHAGHHVNGGLANQVADNGDVVDELPARGRSDLDRHGCTAAAATTSAATGRTGISRAAGRGRSSLIVASPIEPCAGPEGGNDDNT